MQIYLVLYIKNTYTQQATPEIIKNKINKNMYYITCMKWPSSFETTMKINCTSVA